MEKILFVSQTCHHCYDILTKIRQENKIEKVTRSQLVIEFIRKDSEHLLPKMQEALQYLAEHRHESYNDQGIVTPMLIDQSIDGIENVYLGAKEIMEYLDSYD